MNQKTLSGDCLTSQSNTKHGLLCCRQHYPGTSSPDAALRFDKRLWASEEYSTYNDIHGGGCWARVSCHRLLTRTCSCQLGNRGIHDKIKIFELNL